MTDAVSIPTYPHTHTNSGHMPVPPHYCKSMETKVKRGCCRLFVLPPFFFFPIYCSFLNPNLLPPLFLLSSPHYSCLALHSHQFSTPIFTCLSFTYCQRLPTIIIFLLLSSHLVLRVYSIKTTTHLNSGVITTDTTAAYVRVCCGVAEFRLLKDSTHFFS